MSELSNLRTRGNEDPGHSMAWPDALAVTAVILLVALVAGGAFALFLPWSSS